MMCFSHDLYSVLYMLTCSCLWSRI